MDEQLKLIETESNISFDCHYHENEIFVALLGLDLSEKMRRFLRLNVH